MRKFQYKNKMSRNYKKLKKFLNKKINYYKKRKRKINKLLKNEIHIIMNYNKKVI